MSVGGSPSKSGPSASCTTAQTAVGAPSAKASPQPTSPSSVATRTSTCFPSRAVHGDGGSVGCQGIPSGTASTAAIFTGEPRGQVAARRRRPTRGGEKPGAARPSAPGGGGPGSPSRSRSVGDGPGGAGAGSSRFMRFAALTTRKMTNAMTRKSTIAWMNFPIPSTTAGLSPTAGLRTQPSWEKSTPPRRSPIGGMIDVPHQRGDDLPERRADDDADGEIEDVAAQDERLELLAHPRHGRLPTRASVRSGPRRSGRPWPLPLSG